jgi:hypothetical protein
MKIYRMLFLFGALGISNGVFLRADEARPPSYETRGDASWTGVSEAREGDRVTRQSASTYSALFLGRKKWAGAHWYLSGGLQADAYEFQNHGTFPVDRFQDVAAQLSVEYFLRSEKAARLTLYPGFYFQNQLSRDAFDVPFIFVTGVPLVKNFNGVIGVGNSRFLHHPLPVFGVAWIPHPKLRIEAVYPEPAVIFTVNKKLEARLAGQLLGAGFKTDRGSEISRVNYFSYRVGAFLKYITEKGPYVNAGVGVEMKRQFDAYRDQREWKSGAAPFVELSIGL